MNCDHVYVIHDHGSSSVYKYLLVNESINSLWLIIVTVWHESHDA